MIKLFKVFKNQMQFLLIFGLLFSNLSFAQTLSKHIVIDQFGYRSSGQKIAVLRDPQTGADAAESYTPGTSYAVVNTVTLAKVFTGTPVVWNSGAIDPHSGDKVWHFDFSIVTAAGSYYVLDITNNLKSFNFEIKDEVYNEVMKHAVRTFFYQRSGFTKTAPYAGAGWTDGASHIGANQQKNCRYYLDEGNASLEKDLSGGWFDAGDYYKYTPWTAGYIISLLKSYRDNPTAWTDNYNIPESGNNIPDILDEVKWGMDYLLKLQNADGSLIGLVSGDGGSPPSSASKKSLYGKVNTAATLKSAAAYALGAKIFRSIGLNCYADSLELAAGKAWIWAKNNPSVVWNNGTDAQWKTATGWEGGAMNYDDYDRTMMKLEAATYLFDLTGTAEYKTYFDANYTQGHLIAWNHVYPFELDYQEALLHYTLVPGATASVVTAIKNSYNTGMNKSFANNGLGFGPYDSKVDAYNSYMKDYTWGSNSNKCGTGLLFYHLIKYNINSARNNDAIKAAENYVHYIHGLNPLNKVYLSNMNTYGADNSVSEFYHGWFKDGSSLWDKVGVSTYGPAPGFLVGGPNPSYTKDGCCATNSCGSAENNALCNSVNVSSIIGQPNTKSYMDFNNGWPLNSWSISENSCGYQVNYIRLLSHFLKNQGTAVNLNRNCTITKTLETFGIPIEVYPNPSTNSFMVTCSENFTAEIFNLEGKLMEVMNGKGIVEIGDTLSPGTYSIKISQNNNSKHFKVVKL